jgi:hypothetical protein
MVLDSLVRSSSPYAASGGRHCHCDGFRSDGYAARWQRRHYAHFAESPIDNEGLSRTRDGWPVRRLACGRSLGTDRLGIVPTARLGALGGYAGDRVWSRVGVATLGHSLAFSLVASLGWAGDCRASGGGVVPIQNTGCTVFFETSKGRVAETMVCLVERECQERQIGRNAKAYAGYVSATGKTCRALLDRADEGVRPYAAGGYPRAFAGSFSPTRLLTSNTILPAFLSASTTT